MSVELARLDIRLLAQRVTTIMIECGAGTTTIGEEEFSGISTEKMQAGAGSKMDVECSIGTVTITFTE